MPTATEITRVDRGGSPELLVTGRLDSYWARHLADSIDELIREGVHKARLNLSATGYISSAGIRVLVHGYQQFAALGGSLSVVEPSPAVRQILDLSGLASLMVAAEGPEKPAAPGEAVPIQRRQPGFAYEVYDCNPGARLRCRVAGCPDLLASADFREENSESLPLERDLFSVGLGAFGEDYAASRERFGEYLAVAGCAACQPTEENACADDMVESAAFVPRMTTLYSLTCRGKPGKLLRFESQPGAGPVAMSDLLAACIAEAASPAVGIVLLAESAAMLGASLKRSPVGQVGGQIFRHPAVREWISFSPVRGHSRSVALVVGLAVQPPAAPALAPLLRPVRKDPPLLGHFHAAVFGYRPVPKGYLEMESAAKRLFESGGLQAVLHLLADDRHGGAGESEFTRGACWVGPIERVLPPEETL